MKNTIHIWKGQEGTMCELSHIKQDEGYVRLSRMHTPSSIQVNCEECWTAYKKKRDIKPPETIEALTAQRDELVRACEAGLIELEFCYSNHEMDTQEMKVILDTEAMLERAIKASKGE